MTTSSQTTTPLRGDLCPPWCSGEHYVDRDEKTHQQDRGVWHYGAVIDWWQPGHPDAHDPIRVRVEGYRHDDSAMRDWPDEVRADGDVSPGFLSGVSQWSADARRLGEALILAANVMEGRA